MTRNKQSVVDLKQLVENHINDHSFNVTKLCISTKMSRASMYRKTMRLYNCGPKEYLEDIRLEVAKNKIDSDDCCIKVVAFEVGFLDPKYFAKKFKQKYLITPTEYKRQNYPVEEYVEN
jgi:AraC-like DNA-binding protein